MKASMKRKRIFWLAAWGVCCAAVAGAMLWASGQGAVCSNADLTNVPVVPAAAGQSKTPDGEKRVFLTFDDGPSATTEAVLDVLKEKGVCASFFVVGAENNQEYLPLLKRITEEGHQIGLHSCSHSYKTIYESPTAFWADIKQLRQTIEPYVDLDTVRWLRFPGGSTNTVSHKYGGSKIMKTLKEQASEKGYSYVDWNVSAEDAAGGHPNAKTIYENVVAQAKGKNTCVVLMHDTKATKNTVEALPEIIDWFSEQGYRFCGISELDQQI